MKLSKSTKIAVLKGGFSDEREVSLESGKMVAKALRENGYSNIEEIDVKRDICEILKNKKPEVIFNALHGSFGEDGKIQGIFEFLKIPYTGSGVLGSAVGMDKISARIFMTALDINVAESEIIDISKQKPEIKLPFVIKDPQNGSSRGVYIVKNKENFEKITKQKKFKRKVLIEKFFKGREINVAVLNGKVLGDVEIIPKNEFYDFDAKYKSNETQYIVSPKYNNKIKEKIWNAAKNMHNYLNCKGVTRSDFIVTENNYIMLEINTLPGMTAHSLVPMIAENNSISYIKLIELLLEEALGNA